MQLFQNQIDDVTFNFTDEKICKIKEDSQNFRDNIEIIKSIIIRKLLSSTERIKKINNILNQLSNSVE